MNITILSRAQMAALIKEFGEIEILRNNAVVSITSTEDILFQSRHEDLLKLKFDDITPEYLELHSGEGLKYWNYTLFDETHAEQVIEFGDRLKKTQKHLLVHCHAGISRSSATANWLAKYIGFDGKVEHNGYINPNAWVLEVLDKTLAKRLDFSPSLS